MDTVTISFSKPWLCVLLAWEAGWRVRLSGSRWGLPGRCVMSYRPGGSGDPCMTTACAVITTG